MKDVPENELFSAYLDGELTAAEQAQVERLLARSPAAQQLMEELRALSSTLQALPQYELKEDLSEQVLRVAERRILTQAEKLHKPTPRRPAAVLRRFLTPRALAWSGMAVTVAVMLMVMDQNRDKRPGQPIARAPEAAEGRRDREPPSLRRVAGEEDDRLGRASLDDTAAAFSSETHAGDAPTLEKSKQDASRAAPFDEAGKTYDVGKKEGNVSKETSARALARKPSAAGPGSGAAFGARRKGTELSKFSYADKSGEKAGQRVAVEGGRQGSRQIAGKSGGFHQAKQVAGDGAVGAINGTVQDGVGNRRGELARRLAEADTETLVVHLTIDRRAAQQEVFEQTLWDNGIVLVDAAINKKLSGKKQPRDGAAPAPDSNLPGRQSADVALGIQAAAPSIELVYAEAPLEQVRTVLASFSAQRQAVLSLSVRPDPTADQQRELTQFSREGRQHRSSGAGGQVDAETTTEAASSQAADRAFALAEQEVAGKLRANEPSGHAWRFRLSQVELKNQLAAAISDSRKHHLENVEPSPRGRIAAPSTPVPGGAQAAAQSAGQVLESVPAARSGGSAHRFDAANAPADAPKAPRPETNAATMADQFQKVPGPVPDEKPGLPLEAESPAEAMTQPAEPAAPAADSEPPERPADVDPAPEPPPSVQSPTPPAPVDAPAGPSADIGGTQGVARPGPVQGEAGERRVVEEAFRDQPQKAIRGGQAIPDEAEQPFAVRPAPHGRPRPQQAPALATLPPLPAKVPVLFVLHFVGPPISEGSATAASKVRSGPPAASIMEAAEPPAAEPPPVDAAPVDAAPARQ